METVTKKIEKHPVSGVLFCAQKFALALSVYGKDYCGECVFDKYRTHKTTIIHTSVKGENQMLRAEMKEKIKNQRTMIIVQAIFIAVIAINAMNIILLVKEKSYWQGYNEAYDTGVKNGWQSCIEENNLYERYERNEQ